MNKCDCGGHVVDAHSDWCSYRKAREDHTYLHQLWLEDMASNGLSTADFDPPLFTVPSKDKEEDK